MHKKLLRTLAVTVAAVGLAGVGTAGPAAAAASVAPTATVKTIHLGSTTLSGTFVPLAQPHVVTLPGQTGRVATNRAALAANTANPVANVGSVAYKIVNMNSGKCMEVYHSGTGNGANIDQYTCNGSNTQYWYYYQVGTYSGLPVFELVNFNSGECAEVYHSQTTNGSNVDQWTCNGTATQYWIDDSGSNGTAFINFNSGDVLEVHGSSTANYGNVDQWTVNGTTTQYWDTTVSV